MNLLKKIGSYICLVALALLATAFVFFSIGFVLGYLMHPSLRESRFENAVNMGLLVLFLGAITEPFLIFSIVGWWVKRKKDRAPPSPLVTQASRAADPIGHGGELSYNDAGRLRRESGA